VKDRKKRGSRIARSGAGGQSASARTLKDTVRKWLRENGYDDVADLIDDVMEEWIRSGARTRRNWWDTLAGDDHGRPYTVAGREFPILAVARERQGKPPVPGALRRSRREKPPPVRKTKRWK
jgi:hypothetical protein